MPELLESPPAGLLKEIIPGGGGFVGPDNLLEGLTPEQATTVPKGLPHSLAGIVAHAHFWQNWVYQIILGNTPQPVPNAKVGWPEVGPEGWEKLKGEFEEGLEAFLALTSKPQTLSQPLIPSGRYHGWERYTVGAAIAVISMHTAHHLGQVIAVRQAIGVWPPPSGGYTW